MKLMSHSTVKGVLRCDSGLRIGGSKESLEIGGMDNPIIRHPITGLPYIPGSSLKGKIRSLLEIKYSQQTQSSGRPCDCGTCEICKLFGCGNPQNSKEMTRLLFRDAMIVKDSEDILREAQAEKGLNFAEVKSENWIDRRTGKAGHGGLRTQERIPEGSQFEFELSIRIFEGDEKEKTKAEIKEGLDLLESDYLGSSGSRGYGKVKILDRTFDGQPF
jgi:CRISPR-associated protein Csm3